MNIRVKLKLTELLVRPTIPIQIQNKGIFRKVMFKTSMNESI